MSLSENTSDEDHARVLPDEERPVDADEDDYGHAQQ